MIIEIKIEMKEERKLLINTDDEGMQDFLSSVRYVSKTTYDVMYTSENWSGELSSKSVTKSKGYLCSRFDLFPDSEKNEEESLVVFSDDGYQCYTVSIIANNMWFERFAEKIQFLHESRNENQIKICSKLSNSLQEQGNTTNIDIIVSKIDIT